MQAVDPYKAWRGSNGVTTLHDEISAFLTAYFEAWNGYDVPAMRSLWDEREENATYLAEECEPHHGWDEILAYWPVGITMVLRKTAAGWQAIHYAESPLASIVQLREAHEAAVDPALHERLAAKGIRY